MLPVLSEFLQNAGVFFALQMLGVILVKSRKNQKKIASIGDMLQIKRYFERVYAECVSAFFRGAAVGDDLYPVYAGFGVFAYIWHLSIEGAPLPMQMFVMLGLHIACSSHHIQYNRRQSLVAPRQYTDYSSKDITRFLQLSVFSALLQTYLNQPLALSSAATVLRMLSLLEQSTIMTVSYWCLQHHFLPASSERLRQLRAENALLYVPTVFMLYCAHGAWQYLYPLHSLSTVYNGAVGAMLSYPVVLYYDSYLQAYGNSNGIVHMRNIVSLRAASVLRSACYKYLFIIDTITLRAADMLRQLQSPQENDAAARQVVEVPINKRHIPETLEPLCALYNYVTAHAGDIFRRRGSFVLEGLCFSGVMLLRPLYDTTGANVSLLQIALSPVSLVSTGYVYMLWKNRETSYTDNAKYCLRTVFEGFQGVAFALRSQQTFELPRDVVAPIAAWLPRVLHSVNSSYSLEQYNSLRPFLEDALLYAPALPEAIHPMLQRHLTAPMLELMDAGGLPTEESQRAYASLKNTLSCSPLVAECFMVAENLSYMLGHIAVAPHGDIILAMHRITALVDDTTADLGQFSDSRILDAAVIVLCGEETSRATNNLIRFYVLARRVLLRLRAGWIGAAAIAIGDYFFPVALGIVPCLLLGLGTAAIAYCSPPSQSPLPGVSGEVDTVCREFLGETVHHFCYNILHLTLLFHSIQHRYAYYVHDRFFKYYKIFFCMAAVVGCMYNPLMLMVLAVAVIAIVMHSIVQRVAPDVLRADPAQDADALPAAAVLPGAHAAAQQPVRANHEGWMPPRAHGF